MNKKYKAFLQQGDKFQQKIIAAETKAEAVAAAKKLYAADWDILDVEKVPQLYTAHHPTQGHIAAQDYDFELVKDFAWKIAERTGCDIDIYDEDENIVYCTTIL